MIDRPSLGTRVNVFEVAIGDLQLSEKFSPKTFQNQSPFQNHHNLLKVKPLPRRFSESFMGRSFLTSIILNLQQMIRGSVK